MVLPRDVTWLVADYPAGDFEDIREAFGDLYKPNVAALQDLLCNFFTSDDDCASKYGSAISPVGGVAGGGKLLKVRWSTPGGGRSGGLRLAYAVFCDRKLVVLCGAWARKENPDDADFEDAGKRAESFGK